MSFIMYTKQLLSSLCLCSGSIEMSDSSNLPIDIGFLQTVGLLAKPLHEFGTFVVSRDTSSVVIFSSQITSYVAYQ